MLCIAELFLQVKLNYSNAPTIENELETIQEIITSQHQLLSSRAISLFTITC